MKLLMITPRVDLDHDVLGFTNTWINKIAGHVDELYVICLELGRHDLAQNVHIHNLGIKSGKLYKFAYLYQLLLKIVPQIDGIFAHMFPEFIFMVYPFTRIFNKPLVLWYAHGKVTLKLKLAIALVTKAVTSSKLGLRIPSKKICIIGQGINTSIYSPRNGKIHTPLRILSLGRIDPVKNYEVLISAIQMLSNEFPISLDIVGRPNDKGEYYNHIVKLVKDYSLDDFVTFKGVIEHHKIVRYFINSDIFVNSSMTGSLDKAALEAMACGLPVLTCNQSFEEVFGLHSKYFMFKPHSPTDLANKIRAVKENYSFYKQISQTEMRDKITANHSVDTLAKKIVSIFQ